jgi:hypothetical protein
VAAALLWTHAQVVTMPPNALIVRFFSEILSGSTFAMSENGGIVTGSMYGTDKLNMPIRSTKFH